jgi:hypothetical protein
MKKIALILMVLLTVSITVAKTYAQVSIGISIRIAPPVLPVYTQPQCPVDGYLWTPGYWAYDQDGGYYWVPGVWVAPPRPGYLWTPSYWAYDGSVYVYHEGYWGRHIGFYGGVNYGYGYIGSGYVGGQWRGNSFQYNTAVVNVNTTVVHNTYVNKTVINNITVNNTSYNGPGGITAKPRAEEYAASREQHIQPTNDQLTHRQVAVKDPGQFARANNGRPATAAMNKVNGRRFNPEGHVAKVSAANQDAVRSANGNDKADRANNGVVKPRQLQPANDSRASNKPNQGGEDAAKHSRSEQRALKPRGERPAQEKPHEASRPKAHEEHR